MANSLWYGTDLAENEKITRDTYTEQGDFISLVTEIETVDTQTLRWGAYVDRWTDTDGYADR
jgi:hypothetical protein